MAAKAAAMQRLKTAAAQAAARAASAKQEVRSAKALLKQARKTFKAEKKMAKQARRKMEGAAVALTQDRVSKALSTGPKSAAGRTVAPQPGARKTRRRATVVPAGAVATAPKTRTTKPKSQKPQPDTLRSAAEVAKTVIERLHSPPPVRAPTAVIPSEVAVSLAPPPSESPLSESPLSESLLSNLRSRP